MSGKRINKEVFKTADTTDSAAVSNPEDKELIIDEEAKELKESNIVSTEDSEQEVNIKEEIINTPIMTEETKETEETEETEEIREVEVIKEEENKEVKSKIVSTVSNSTNLVKRSRNN